MSDSLLTSGICSFFMADVHAESANSYTMVLQDPAHFLMCKLILEVQKQETEGSRPNKKGGKPREVICHFPKIDADQLEGIVCHNATLYGIVMVTFQMKILEQLFFFCANHHAENLVIVADGSQAKDLGIYRDFLVCKNQPFISVGEQEKLAISVNQETFEDWVDFMEIITLRFEQILCRGQKTNPAIQSYLKSQGFVRRAE